MKLGVLLVHGIGIQGPDWAAGIIRSLNDAVSQALSAEIDLPHPPAVDDVFAVEPVYWEGILHEREELLRRVLEAEQARGGLLKRVSLGLWRRFWHWLRRREYAFVADYLGDVIGYLHPETRRLIQQALARSLDRLIAQTASEKEPMLLTLVGHSLGTVIASEYVWDARQRLPAKDRPSRWMLENFISVGSPLALFSLKFGTPDEYRKPIRVETPHGRWINIFDVDDPVGMPLRPLNDAYAQAVHADVRVEAGVYLVSHESYFRHSSTLRIIGRKLALDWLRLEGRLSPEQAAARYAAFDRWIQDIDE